MMSLAAKELGDHSGDAIQIRTELERIRRHPFDKICHHLNSDGPASAVSPETAAFLRRGSLTSLSAASFAEQ